MAFFLNSDLFSVQCAVQLVQLSHRTRALLSRSWSTARKVVSAFPAMQSWISPSIQSNQYLQMRPPTLCALRLLCLVSQALAAWAVYDRRAHRSAPHARTLATCASRMMEFEAKQLDQRIPFTALAVWLVCDGFSLSAFGGGEVPGFVGRFLSLAEAIALVSRKSTSPGAAAEQACETCTSLFLPITDSFNGRRLWLSRVSGAVHVGPMQPPNTSGEFFAALSNGQQIAAVFGPPKYSSLLQLLRVTSGLVG